MRTTVCLVERPKPEETPGLKERGRRERGRPAEPLRIRARLREQLQTQRLALGQDRRDDGVRERDRPGGLLGDELAAPQCTVDECPRRLRRLVLLDRDECLQRQHHPLRRCVPGEIAVRAKPSRNLGRARDVGQRGRELTLEREAQLAILPRRADRLLERCDGLAQPRAEHVRTTELPQRPCSQRQILAGGGDRFLQILDRARLIGAHLGAPELEQHLRALPACRSFGEGSAQISD